MSTRLRKLSHGRVYETLATIICERTCGDDPSPNAGVWPLPLDSRDNGPTMLVRWPYVGDRQLIVGVTVGHTTVYLMRGGRPVYRFEVDPSKPRLSLVSLVHRGWDWVHGRPSCPL